MSAHQIVPTVMRAAFDAIIVGRGALDSKEGRRIGTVIVDKLGENKGSIGFVKRKEWNAKLSMDTYNQLKREGVMV